MTAPASITKAQMHKAIQVAREAGLPLVELVLPNGATLRYHLQKEDPEDLNPADLIDP